MNRIVSFAFVSFFCLLTVSSCHKRLHSSAFVPPIIPQSLATTTEKTDYLLDHYWDAFVFDDTSLVVDGGVLEPIWQGYVEALSMASSEKACSSMVETLHKAEKNKALFVQLTELSDLYFYHPDSPYRSDSLYRSVLEVESSTPITTEDEKVFSKSRLALINRNRVGGAAENFPYTKVSGEKGELYDLNSPYILLFFNDPHCYACEEMKEALKRNKLINQLIDSKKLLLLALYPYGNTGSWGDQSQGYPPKWNLACDENQTILNEERYDLMVVPCMYLLDNKKTVLIKEASVRQVEAYFKTKM